MDVLSVEYRNMAIIVYPKSLLESWAKLGPCRKPVRRPVMEAKSSDFDTGDDDFTDDDLGDREVDAKFGNFGSIVDYSGDDNMGYDETGVDTDLDNQYKRFGMNVEEIDPLTGLPKDDPKSKSKKSKKKTPAEEKSSYKVMLDAVKVRRLSDAKAAYSAIKAIGTRYIGLYEALPADYISDDMHTYIDGIKETGPARNEAMSYITSAQRLIHYMEQLGIAARKNNTVPDGIPENLITPEQLSTLILLCENETSLMKKLNGDDVDTKMLSSRRLAMKARSINQNILGLGTAEEPTMPSPSEKNLYIGFAPWESRIFSSGANEVPSNLTDTKKAREENRGDSLSDDRVIHYLGTADSAGATIVVPHQFFTSVCKRIDEDRTVMHKKARESLKDEFNGSTELTASYLLVYGERGLKDSFGVAPPRIKETSGAACYLQILTSAGKQGFTGTTTCINLFKSMFENCLKEISGKQATFVDSNNEECTEFPAPGSYEQTANGHTLEKRVGVEEFLKNLISTLNGATNQAGAFTKTFNSTELAFLIRKEMRLRRKPRKAHINGKWTMTTSEPVPLFDYIQVEGSGTLVADSFDATPSDSPNAQRAPSQRILYDDVMDSTRSLTSTAVTEDYINTFLAHPALNEMCAMIGVDPETSPSPNSPEKEKINFCINVVLNFSNIMSDLGATSYVTRRPGNTIEEVISDEDKSTYGRNCTIADVWKGTMKTVDNAAKSTAGYGEDGGFDFSGLSPETVRFLRGKSKPRTNLFTYIRYILGWLNTFQNYDYDRDDMVTALTGRMDEFKQIKDRLNPYLEMVPLIVNLASSGILSNGDKNSNEFKLATSYISKMQNDINTDLMSPKFIEDVIAYVNRNYSGVDDMLAYATNDAPFNWEQMLEWCVVRFLMSGIDDDGKLVPPDDVGKPNESADGEPTPGAANQEDRVPPILQKYRAILAAKPAYLKRDAWLKKNNINPDTYDYLEQQASGEGSNTRIIDMTPGELAGWMSDTYISHGDAGEVILLMLGLLYVGTIIHDSDLKAVSRFKENNVNEKMHDASMHYKIRLTNALAEYGVDFLGEIIGNVMGDNGAALAALLNIINATEPLTLAELEEFLEPAVPDPENPDENGDAPVVREPKTETEIADDLHQMIGQLMSTSFLEFNGIE